MKHFIFTAVFFSLLSFYGNAQTVVEINNQDGQTPQKKCEYMINGICSTEDIGGVDVNVIYQSDDNGNYITFTNYNSFTVTVLYEIGCSINFSTWRYKVADGTTGSMVLPTNGTKKIKVFEAVTKGDCSGHFFLKGIIVRKLSN